MENVGNLGSGGVGEWGSGGVGSWVLEDDGHFGK